MRHAVQQAARTLRIIAVAVLVAVGAITVMPGLASASWTTANQHQLIPIYTYPSYYDPTANPVVGNDLTHACDMSNATLIGSTMVTNSGDKESTGGPTLAYNYNYAQAFEHCHSVGQNVVGYVNTGYGSVALATVEGDIYHTSGTAATGWLDEYNGTSTNVVNEGSAGIDTHIDGIFLDLVATDKTASASGWPGHTIGDYYHTIFNYVKTHAAGSAYNDVVGNPGTVSSTTEWQLNDVTSPSYQAADELVVFEGTPAGLGSFSQPAWVFNYPASDIAMLVHADLTPPATLAASDYASICTTLKNDNAGLVDVTPLNGNWTALQSSTQFSYMRTYCG